MFRTHKTLYFVLFILGAIGIAIGLLFAIQSFRTDEEIASGYNFPFKTNLLRHRGVEIPEVDEPETASSTISLEIGEPIDTSDWNSYRNEKWGFGFKYPKGTKLSEHNFSDVGVKDKFRVSCRNTDECMNVTAEFPNGQIMDFVFQKIELGRDLSGAVNKQKITVANKEYEIWIDKNYYIKVWLNNGSVWLYNDIGPSGVRSTDISLFLNVLSTFKFLGLEYDPET